MQVGCSSTYGDEFPGLIDTGEKQIYIIVCNNANILKQHTCFAKINRSAENVF